MCILPELEGVALLLDRFVGTMRTNVSLMCPVQALLTHLACEDYVDEVARVQDEQCYSANVLARIRSLRRSQIHMPPHGPWHPTPPHMATCTATNIRGW